MDGTLVQDTVTVGSVKVYNQSFGAASQVSPSFAQSPSDGLAGLAFSTIADSHQLTLFENLMSYLAAPLFSFYMTRTQSRGSEVSSLLIRVSGLTVVAKGLLWRYRSVESQRG